MSALVLSSVAGPADKRVGVRGEKGAVVVVVVRMEKEEGMVKLEAGVFIRQRSTTVASNLRWRNIMLLLLLL